MPIVNLLCLLNYFKNETCSCGKVCHDSALVCAQILPNSKMCSSYNSFDITQEAQSSKFQS